MDDIYLFGHLDTIKIAAQEIIDSLLKHGLSFNNNKTVIFNIKDPPTQNVNNKGLKLLGIPIGTDDYIKKEATNIFSSLTKILNLISKLDSIHAIKLLRFCISARPTYFLRCIHHTLSLDSSVKFDQEVHDCLLKILHSPEELLTQYQKNIIHLPIKLGGLGLRSAELTREEAFRASFFECLRYIENYIPRLYCFTRSSLNNFPATYTEFSQKELTISKNITILNQTESLLSDSPNLKHLFLSGKSKETQSWILNPVSSDKIFKLSDEEYSSATRLKLLFPAQPQLDTPCSCGKINVNDPFHFLNCNKASLVITARHNAIRDRLCKFIHNCNIGQTPIIEQKIAGTNLICDIIAKTNANCNDFIDVCIVNPAANTYINKVAMDIRDKFKDRKYRKALKDSKIIYNIVPFILELTGRLHSNARDYIFKLGKIGSGFKYPKSSKILRNILIHDLNVILTKFNAQLVINGYFYTQNIRISPNNC